MAALELSSYCGEVCDVVLQSVSGNYVNPKRVHRVHRDHHFDTGYLGLEAPPKGARAISSLRLKVESPHGTSAGKAMQL